jgi:hypothetical protein
MVQKIIPAASAPVTNGSTWKLQNFAWGNPARRAIMKSTSLDIGDAIGNSTVARVPRLESRELDNE